ncbi:TAAR1 protein, partial [Amia calva]|nr:TAAR1 protein [Amia calva]
MVEHCWYMVCWRAPKSTSLKGQHPTAIDRYYAVCEPLRYANKINIRVAWIFIILAWVLGALCTFGAFFSSSNDQSQELVAMLSCEGACVVPVNNFFVPCFVMIGIYERIYTVARNQVRLIKIMEDRTFTLEDSRRAQRNREHKAAKTLGIIMGVFIGCYLPYYIVNLIFFFFIVRIPEVLFTAVLCLVYINSAFNPLIYAFFYPWF